MAQIYNGHVLKPDIPFVDVHGNQYPAGWLRHHTLEEKEAIGIIEVPDNPHKKWFVAKKQ